MRGPGGGGHCAGARTGQRKGGEGKGGGERKMK